MANWLFPIDTPKTRVLRALALVPVLNIACEMREHISLLSARECRREHKHAL